MTCAMRASGLPGVCRGSAAAAGAEDLCAAGRSSEFALFFLSFSESCPEVMGQEMQRRVAPLGQSQLERVGASRTQLVAY